jgi:hypothetical protein
MSVTCTASAQLHSYTCVKRVPLAPALYSINKFNMHKRTQLELQESANKPAQLTANAEKQDAHDAQNDKSENLITTDEKLLVPKAAARAKAKANAEAAAEASLTSSSSVTAASTTSASAQVGIAIEQRRMKAGVKEQKKENAKKRGTTVTVKK